MSFIMSLEPDDFAALVRKAAEKHQESRAWDMYVAQLPYMDKKNRKGFDEFLAAATGGAQGGRRARRARSGLAPEEIDAKFTKVARLHSANRTQEAG